MSVRACALLLGLLSVTLANAAQAPTETDPRVAIAARIPGTAPDQLRATPIPNIYELSRGADVAYVTTDGKYAFSGDLIDLPQNKDLTEAHKRDVRLKEIGQIPESEMVVFGPRDARYTITVFTDVDCAYCRQLHSQISDYNRMGIRVRYLFYPRTGPNTSSWTKAEQVWCSSDRNAALTRAKRGETLTGKASCGESPVAKEYELGRQFDLRGTPAIIMANGDMLPGYVSPAELAQELRSVDH